MRRGWRRSRFVGPFPRAQCHARAAVARWVADYNHRRPHSAIGYATPAAYAAHLTAMGDRLRVTEALRQSPIAPSAQRRQFDRRTPASAG
ncbi:integrase core domain-containing protein [Amaricoccus sp.]|uniref:integrase core domain-containing protein n=1 Tax=Amaricoccus sp. TaxID=1872485 RepID=UPI003FA5A4F5